jgi:hypothetical protein
VEGDLCFKDLGGKTLAQRRRRGGAEYAEIKEKKEKRGKKEGRRE